MYKVVIDTNVFISGVISKGIPSFLIDLWKEGKFHLLISEPIINEMIEVMHRPRIKDLYKIDNQTIEELIIEIYEKAEIVRVSHPIDVIKDDPGDNKFLACALEGGADYIITGDIHLINIKSFRNIQIVNPREFINILKKTTKKN